MGCYGYCVVPRAHEPGREQAGIGGKPVAARVVDRVALWWSEMDRPEPSVEHVQQHNAVIEAALTDTVTPVPLRFGQWSEDPEVFDRVISEKLGWYEERLAIFAGAMEFGIRVVQPDQQAPARVVRVPLAKTGTAYMNALRESAAAAQDKKAEADAVRMQISTVVGNLVREEHVEEARTPHGLVTVSHLVARENFEAYKQRVLELREQFVQLRFLLSGPWAPYSFAA